MDQEPSEPLPAQCERLQKELLDEWKRAESDVKQAELVASKVVFPSIKELRYAGRRLAEACVLIMNEEFAEAKKKLQDAIYNCHRARHDALDAATAKIAGDIEVMAKSLGYSAITQAFHKFSTLHHALNVCRNRIVASRAEVSQRESIYLNISETDFPALVSLYRELQGCEPVIRRIAKAERRHVTVLYIGLGVETLVILVGGLELWSKWH